VSLAAVLFDLDGTLLDHDAARAAAIRAWLPAYGIGPDAIEAAIPRWGELERVHDPAGKAGKVSLVQQRRRRTQDFFGELGIPIRAKQLDAAFAEYLAGYRAGWTAYDDAVPALQRVAAQGLQAGVLTNGDLAQQIAKLAATRLIRYCGPVLVSSALPAPKPDRRAFLEACLRLNTSPAQVLMVGDNYAVDVLGARAAGLAAIHLDRSGRYPEAAGERISTLNDLYPG
jgi:putative hydrolase of the HAD superfamily